MNPEFKMFSLIVNNCSYFYLMHRKSNIRVHVCLRVFSAYKSQNIKSKSTCIFRTRSNFPSFERKQQRLYFDMNENEQVTDKKGSQLVNEVNRPSSTVRHND